MPDLSPTETLPAAAHKLRVVVELRTPLPVSVRDLPTLEQLAYQATAAHGVDPATVTMRQLGDDLVLSYEVVAS